MIRAAAGTCLVFTASGSLLGTWVARIPAIVRQLGITEGQLGRALLVLGVGSLLSMPFTGRLCRQVGSRTWVGVTAVVATAAQGFVGFAGGLWALTAAMFVLGLAFGSWDVAMNVQGSAVDRRAGREWMPRYHACWSLGSIAGAAAGSAAAHAGIGPGPHLAVAAGVALLVTLAGLTLYIDERAGDRPTDKSSAERQRWRPGRALILLGVLTLCSTVAEGAAGDWLALYLDKGRGLTESAAALGFTVFATAMTVGRFLGTPIAARLGRARAVRIGGLLTVAGVLVTVLTPWTGAVYPGALLWALGICLVFPAAISAAGETERPGDAIALVTSIGYASILIGPPLIGAVADEIGLGRALLGVVVLGVGITALAKNLKTGQADRASIAR